jgi:hypothetical protein
VSDAPRALACPRCGAPTPFRAPSCAYCGERLAWRGLIELAFADPIATADLSRVALPGTTYPNATREGDHVRIAIQTNRVSWGTFDPRLCDAGIVVTGTCLDAHGSLAVVARLISEGNSVTYYSARVDPASRSARLERAIFADRLHVEALSDWEVNTAIAGVGARNELALLCADSLVQVRVNGVLVISVIDARFGYGRFGWRVDADESGPSVVRLDRVELFHVE